MTLLESSLSLWTVGVSDTLRDKLFGSVKGDEQRESLAAEGRRRDLREAEDRSRGVVVTKAIEVREALRS